MAQLPPAPGAPPAPAPAAPAANPAKRQEFLAGRRNEVKQVANTGLQQNNDAIARRFAAMGASGSGAQIAAGLKAQDQAAGQERAGLQDVAGQEMQMNEADAARELQSSQFDRNLALQQQGQNNQVDQFGKQYGLSAEQFLQDQLDNKFNIMGQYGVGDVGAAFTDRYGAWGKDNAALERRLGYLRGGK